MIECQLINGAKRMITKVKDTSHAVILVIDDEPNLRDTYRRYLEHLHYTVLVADNGQTGLEMFELGKPDLVLTDLRMPQMDGLEVLMQVRKRSPDTPVIIISGKGEIDDVIKALRLGAWNYLSKPLDSLLVLEHVVQKALENARLVLESRHATANKLEQLALYDSLTGFPNRIYFQDLLAHEIAHARRKRSQIALLLVDLDHFKWVNDSLGHAAGDNLIKEVSRRLQLCIRDSDRIARLGGDEFTIMLTNVIYPGNAASLAQKLIAMVEEPITLLGQNVHVGASVGIAIYPEDADTMENLLKHADIAMYQAKKAGRNTFQFFSKEFHATAFERIAMEDALHKALERHELIVHYQPKLDLVTNRLSGAEALVRWIKPDGCLVNPAQFIPLAEETGLILPIGKQVLHAACQFSAQWIHAQDNPMKIAVNLSSREFNQPNLVKQIHDILQETDLPPEQLEIEITESMVMGNMEKAIAIMWKLRDLGISLAMDDFGTGYSSLGYLKRFPLNILKIDRSFVQDLPGCLGDGAIVDAILSMAHSLKLHVVAEGVETQEQLDYLRQRECETAQGFLIAKPMSKEDLLNFCASHDCASFALLEEKSGQSQQVKKSVTKGRVHDLSNALQVILTNSQLMLDQTPHASDEYMLLDGIVKAGMRSKDVIRQLVDVNKQNNERVLLAHVPAEIKPDVTGQLRILLVEDQLEVGSIVKKLLEVNGFHVNSFNDPLETLAYIRLAPESFDLLLTDLNMPALSGRELAHALMEINPAIPVIICSGYGDHSILSEKGLENVRDCLSKPLTSIELTNAIRTVFKVA